MKNFKKFLVLAIAVIVVLFASCGGNNTYKTRYAKETTTSQGCMSKSSQTYIEWIDSVINKGVISSTDEDSTLSVEQIAAARKENLINLISTYVIEEGIAGSDDQEKINEHFQVINIREDKKQFINYVNLIDANDFIYESDVKDLQIGLSSGSCAGMFNVKDKQNVATSLNSILDGTSTEKDGYRIAMLYIIRVQNRQTELEPMVLHAASFGDFMGHLWNNFIFLLGWLTYNISMICGGFYWVGLLVITLLIRTLGWPIYSKTNDMSQKMADMQPELTKIQEKYANRQDKESQRMMQMEQAQLYKKYKVGIGGCLAPIIQFPIFIAVYRAVSRLPYTVNISEKYHLDWANNLNPNLFKLNLFNDMSIGGTPQIIGVIILLVLVVGTQVLSQILSKIRTKKNNEKRQEDIPAYRRQAYQQSQNQTQMNLMMYGLIAMMGIFVWTSKAGLGLYWLIGNVYSIGQMAVNNITYLKKEKEKDKKRGIIDVKPNKR